jgi:proline iminopeptidase
MAAREGWVRSGSVGLFVRDVGNGTPLVVVHGGPDFDHRYLLPDLDRLADGYRLIYYDQRGRGRSRGEVVLDEIAIERYIDDLDAVRHHFALDAMAIVGHSWGGIVAMHYALAHPGRVSRMILLNTAPASYDDCKSMRAERLRRCAPDIERLRAIESTAAFEEGDPETVAEYYRVMYRTAFARPELAHRLQLTFPSREDVVLGRAIEDRLMEGLIWSEGFTLVPALRTLPVRTLLLHGDEDFVPVECARHIADAVRGARLEVIANCGHFSYIEAPEETRVAVDRFVACA